METINGVSFEEYAAACGNLAQGMPEEKVIEILQLEKPVWDETLDQWNNRLGELMTEDMNYATVYGELFAKPVAGRFAGEAVATIDDILPLAPDYDTYQKIFWHQSVAASHGVDPVTVLESYGIDLGKWGTLNMHYINYQNNLLDHTAPDYAEKFQYFTALQDKWRNHFEEEYSSSNLSEDIDF
jgi:triacylglycerol lipase